MRRRHLTKSETGNDPCPGHDALVRRLPIKKGLGEQHGVGMVRTELFIRSLDSLSQQRRGFIDTTQPAPDRGQVVHRPDRVVVGVSEHSPARLE